MRHSRISNKWIGILSLVVGTLIVVSVAANSASAKSGGTRTLVIDAIQTFATDFTSNMDKGERKYSETDLFDEGISGISDPIGQRLITEVATEPVGVPAGIGWGVYTLFGEGDIFTSEAFGIEEDGVFRTRGVINGGTGKFFGASGTIAGEFFLVNSNGDNHARWTFEFERSIQSHSDKDG